MIFSEIKYKKHQRSLEELPKIPQNISDISTFYSPKDFCKILLKNITMAKNRICIVTLYLENDNGGCKIMEALYAAKYAQPQLDISILVDWHRAHRNRIGTQINTSTNADWYYKITKQHKKISIPIYGIPVHTREALGVLHLKGFIFDDKLLYTGANISNSYLYYGNKYRYDRYHLIRNLQLTNSMFNWIKTHIKQSEGIHRLDHQENQNHQSNKIIKSKIHQFRKKLRTTNYQFIGNTENKTLSVSPLIGLGKQSLLNKMIFHLIPCAQKKIIICTPYFNFSNHLTKEIIKLLHSGKEIEIIVGDKTANDFYTPPDQKFKIINILPYLYETNLRRFLNQLYEFIQRNQLIIRLWKNKNNSYHLKGIWIDNNWMLITGNNLNARAWRLDLENAILIHDPLQELKIQREKELLEIRNFTTKIKDFNELDEIQDYPIKIKKFIQRLHRVRIDRLINRIL